CSLQFTTANIVTTFYIVGVGIFGVIAGVALEGVGIENLDFVAVSQTITVAIFVVGVCADSELFQIAQAVMVRVRAVATQSGITAGLVTEIFLLPYLGRCHRRGCGRVLRFSFRSGL